jgi:phosphate:Na+ symporter
MSRLNGNFFKLAAAALESDDHSVIKAAQELEDAIDRLEEQLRDSHIARLNTGECTVSSGLIYLDIVHNLEKIGDHTFKMAKTLSAPD